MYLQLSPKKHDAIKAIVFNIAVSIPLMFIFIFIADFSTWSLLISLSVYTYIIISPIIKFSRKRRLIIDKYGISIFLKKDSIVKQHYAWNTIQNFKYKSMNHYRKGGWATTEYLCFETFIYVNGNKKCSAPIEIKLDDFKPFSFNYYMYGNSAGYYSEHIHQVIKELCKINHIKYTLIAE